MIIEREPASGIGVLTDAAESYRVNYQSRSVRGESIAMSGLVHIPHGARPRDGWPFASYGHMTTGGCDWAAPSLADTDHPEVRRMTQGDAFVSALLERGFAVVCPDYEGLGSRGPHPYLIGTSLARSVIDLAQASRQEFGFASQWISTGHSEGAVAALWAAASADKDPAAKDLELRGVCAFAPVTRLESTIGFALRWSTIVPGFEVVTPLIALMLSGAATVDPHLGALLDGKGLSEAARAVWSHLGERSLSELCAKDSFGAIAPKALLGDDGREVRNRLLESFRRNEVATLQFPLGMPLRVEAARFDEVAPFWLTQRALRAWRDGGVDLEHRWWSTSHSPILRSDRAPQGAAEWCAQSFS